MLSVFIDTLLICTATAFMCLSTSVVPTEEIAGAVYVQNAIASTLGTVGPVFLAVAMMLFAFTTLLGNYSYCEAVWSSSCTAASKSMSCSSSACLLRPSCSSVRLQTPVWSGILRICCRV